MTTLRHQRPLICPSIDWCLQSMHTCVQLAIHDDRKLPREEDDLEGQPAAGAARGRDGGDHQRTYTSRSVCRATRKTALRFRTPLAKHSSRERTSAHESTKTLPGSYAFSSQQVFRETVASAFLRENLVSQVPTSNAKYYCPNLSCRTSREVAASLSGRVLCSCRVVAADPPTPPPSYVAEI